MNNPLRAHLSAPHAVARRSRTDQRGLTLIEALVAILVLAAFSAAVSMGLVTLTRTSAMADLQARADALLSGAAETIKQMPYQPCATPAAYQTAYEAYEAGLPAEQRLEQRSDAAVAVTAVDAGTRCDTDIDAGVQIITLTAAVGPTDGVRQRTAQIVKRDPNAAPDGPLAVIDTPVQMTSGTDLLYTVALTAKGSTATLGILKFDWDCGPDAYTGSGQSRTYTTYTADDPGVLCTYQAPALGSPAGSVTVSLGVTDNGLAEDSTTRDVTVPAATSSRVGPTAAFSFTQTSTAIQGNDYNPGTAVFNASASAASDGSDLTYRWVFGDTASGALNDGTGVGPTHVFYAPGSFTVTLTVTDDFGMSATTSRTVLVKDASTKAPTVTFVANPATGVVPQLVSFNSTGTYANAAGASLVPSSYVWNFGDGGNDTGPSPTHRYTVAGTYTVTLTVTDTLGNTAATARTVTYTTLPPPPGFTMYDARGEFFHGGDFYFAWTNAGGSPGDSISYEIEVKATFGCLAFGTQTRTVAASGGAGTAQSYDFAVPMPATNVCLGSTYQYRTRTKRVSATEGTTYSAWTTPTSFHITHT